MKMTSLILFLLFLGSSAFPEDEVRIKPLDTITELPDQALRSLDVAFSKESVPYWLAIGGSTAVLYKYDEELLAESKRLGRKWDIPEDDKTETKLKLAGQDIIRLPTDKGSALYFLGDGWMHTTIAGSFLAAGYATDSTRPINTGYQIIHGMFLSTIFNQTLKRSFGRESPKQSSEPRGKWRPFPNPKKYSANTEKYDAMPSGHIMTATMTFTVIAGNYPEYINWIYPIQGLWTTALAFQMMNNGVHWASDYPLGIAMGFLYGYTALELGKPHEKKNETKDEIAHHTNIQYYPSVSEDGPMFNAIYYF